mmetsp:Transcript_17383/g.35874  ORF Transcript_17383/g.35874 Transcript_17383/m.35874 type:complete len:248 (-) Transcript_17383:1538-2281(-)
MERIHRAEASGLGCREKLEASHGRRYPQGGGKAEEDREDIRGQGGNRGRERGVGGGRGIRAKPVDEPEGHNQGEATVGAEEGKEEGGTKRGEPDHARRREERSQVAIGPMPSAGVGCRPLRHHGVVGCSLPREQQRYHGENKALHRDSGWSVSKSRRRNPDSGCCHFGESCLRERKEPGADWKLWRRRGLVGFVQGGRRGCHRGQYCCPCQLGNPAQRKRRKAGFVWWRGRSFSLDNFQPDCQLARL